MFDLEIFGRDDKIGDNPRAAALGKRQERAAIAVIIDDNVSALEAAQAIGPSERLVDQRVGAFRMQKGHRRRDEVGQHASVQACARHTANRPARDGPAKPRREPSGELRQ
ncbi:hypothetical protein [Methylosinus sp. LW3]|uniref:hypothetical protein n=1 Tax=Methylosinus sp. LW3 TaxID=107635 RepID=UPI0032AEA14C